MLPGPTALSSVPSPGSAVVFVQVPGSVSNIVDSYKGNQSFRLGIAQLIIGVLCIIFNAVLLVLGYFTIAILGHGIWCGLLFMVSGGMGVAAGKKKTKCKIIAFMVLCIISASATAVLFIFGVLGAILDGSYCYRYYDCSPVLAMNCLLALLAITEAIVSIWAAVLCCKATCCGARPAYQAVMVNNPGQNQQQFTSGQQYIMPYPQGPTAPPDYSPNYGQAAWTQFPVTNGASGDAPPSYPTKSGEPPFWVELAIVSSDWHRNTNNSWECNQMSENLQRQRIVLIWIFSICCIFIERMNIINTLWFAFDMFVIEFVALTLYIFKNNSMPSRLACTSAMNHFGSLVSIFSSLFFSRVIKCCCQNIVNVLQYILHRRR